MHYSDVLGLKLYNATKVSTNVCPFFYLIYEDEITFFMSLTTLFDGSINKIVIGDIIPENVLKSFVGSSEYITWTIIHKGSRRKLNTKTFFTKHFAKEVAGGSRGPLYSGLWCM